MVSYSLHLINDDFNHQLDVESALIEVCNLDASEAEAFTLIAHMEGSFPVFGGKREVVETMKGKLEELGITTQITDVGQEPV